MIRRSKAKTAYTLLGEIQKLIKAEPLRYDQGTYLDREGDQPEDPAHAAYPPCGTVGCVAGWTTTLIDGQEASSWGAHGRAQRILGLTGKQADELFDGGAAGGTTEQTPEHAAAGVKHIASFRKKYKAQLQQRRIVRDETVAR